MEGRCAHKGTEGSNHRDAEQEAKQHAKRKRVGGHHGDGEGWKITVARRLAVS
jgi:hypothetical protein